MSMSKKNNGMKYGPMVVASLCLSLVYANPLYANPITFGPGTGSFSVTSYANAVTGDNGLEWNGYVYGIDSLGQRYNIFDEPGNGYSNGAYLAYDHNANDWIVSSMTTAYGATYSWWDSTILLADSSLFVALGIRQSTNLPETLSQASNGAISLAIEVATGCMAQYPYYCRGGGTENLVLNLQDDPVMLSSLANGQSVALSVTGGCVTSGTSCGASPVSSIPESPTLVLFGTGLFLISYIYRRKKM